MNTLKQKLEEFAEWPHNTEDELTNAFEKLAQYLLYCGYFLVNKKKNIYLDDIEFYYHEEGEEREGKFKDPAMYHTNDHDGLELKRELPYFETGRLNLHQSGIDITFENEKSRYRASCLIRGFIVDGNKHDSRSTYIYYDMLEMGLPLDKPIEIEWVYDPRPCGSIKNTGRQNIVKYAKDENGYYIKDEKGKYKKKVKGTTKSNKPIYEPCDRPWRFYKADNNIS